MSLYVFTNTNEHANEHANDNTTRTYMNGPSISRNSSKNNSMNNCSSFYHTHPYLCAFPYDEEILKHNDPIRDAIFHSKHLNVDIFDDDYVSDENETYTPRHMKHDLDQDEIIKELLVPLKSHNVDTKNKNKNNKNKKTKNTKNKMNKFIKSIKHWFRN